MPQYRSNVLHHHLVFSVNERVIQVGGVQGEYALHQVIEEYLLDPVLLADRVEGQDDLLDRKGNGDP